MDKVRENALFDKLSALLEAAFQEVVFKLDAPRKYLEAPGTPLATRAITLIEWTKQQNKLLELERLVAEIGGSDLIFPVAGPRSRRRSTMPSTVGEPPFTGRVDELRAIEDLFGRDRVVVLHGAPGIGKSRLATEYAQRHRSAYPGGMFLVPFAQLPPLELAKLLREPGRAPSAGESLDDQCRRALLEMGGDGRVLIVYDAVTDEHTLRGWLPNDELEWHLIVTSTFASWAASWNAVKVGALDEQAAGALVTRLLADAAAAERLAPAITDKAAGITIELCASATAAYKQLQRGRPVKHVPDELAPETIASFMAAWGLLSRNAQIALSVASAEDPHIPVERIVSVLEDRGWSRSAVDAAIDEARDRSLLMGDAACVEAHPLLAQWIRNSGLLAKLSVTTSAQSSPSALARSIAEPRIISDSAPRSSPRSERWNPAETARSISPSRVVSDAQHQAPPAAPPASVPGSPSHCSDLDLFFDGELDAVRADAFRDHLRNCVACQTGLLGAMQLQIHLGTPPLAAALVEDAPRAPWPVPGSAAQENHANRSARGLARSDGLLRSRLSLLAPMVAAAAAVVALTLRASHSAPIDEFAGLTPRSYEIRMAYPSATEHRPPRDVALDASTAAPPTDRMAWIVQQVVTGGGHPRPNPR